MSDFNGQTGRWVTTKDGRKVFISDKEDLVDKQEREIAEQAKLTKELTDRNTIKKSLTPPERSAEDTAKTAVANLVENQAEFEHDEQSGISGEQSANDWLHDIGLTNEEVDRAMSGKFDYTLSCKLLGKLGRYMMYGKVTKERIAKVLEEDYDVNVSGKLLDDVFRFVED